MRSKYSNGESIKQTLLKLAKWPGRKVKTSKPH